MAQQRLRLCAAISAQKVKHADTDSYALVFRIRREASMSAPANATNEPTRRHKADALSTPTQSMMDIVQMG